MIGEIELAILARVRAASDQNALGYRLPTIASYAGETDDDLATRIKAFPAVWVHYAGSSFSERGGGQHQAESTFAVIAASKNAGGEEARRHGDQRKPGAYRIALDCLGLLAGQTLGLDIQPFKPRRIVSIGGRKLAQKQIAPYMLELRVLHGFPAVRLAGGIADFATFHADWDLPPIGNVTPPLPAANADASDTVELETS